MRYQTRPFTCGPAAIANALRIYGRKVPEAQIAKLAGTTANGTDDRGIIKALRQLECKPTVVGLTSTVRKRVLAGLPVIIHLDEELHWVVVIGCLGRNFIAFDSDPSHHNKKEHGVRIISPEELGKKVYGVCVKSLTAETK